MNLFELFVKIGVDDQASGKLSNLSSKLGNGLKTAAKIGTAAVGAAAAGITALTTAAVNNYAEYEQLVGGIETLFEDLSWDVGQNAAKAFQTAGLSANEYMSTAMSFAASLNQSLTEMDGNIARSADLTDQAILDMADNANKMGSDMSTIQNAYAGFAKQNYTMLDNLKLGYGGTKEEMQRLISRAAELSDTVDAQSMSFANIVEAIHVVQKDMGVTGTTALEAGRTISGSVGAMKSAWTNLITGLADGNADIGSLIDNLVTTIVGDGTENNLGVLGNIMPAVKRALNGASKLVQGLLPKIVQEIPTIINENLPILAEAAISIVQSLVDGISANQEMLMKTAFETIVFLAKSILKMLPQIVALGLDLIISLANGLAESLPELIPTIIDVVMQIVDTITEPKTLNNLLDSALAIILALADGLVKFIPQMIEAAVTLIEKLVVFLLEPSNIKKLAETAVKIVVALAEGLIKSVGTLMNAAGKLISNVVAKFKETNWGQIGRNIVDGVLSGLKNAWSNLKSWFTNAFNNLVGGVKDLLGIHSPSRVFAGIGKNMALGIGEGWDDEFGSIQNDIDKSLSFDDASIGITSSIRKVGAGVAGGAFGGTSIGNITINIDGAKYSDEQSLASAIALEIQNMTDRRAAVYA